MDWDKRREKITEIVENHAIWLDHKYKIADKIITQEQFLIYDVIFKMYCPLVVKGVDKEMLKEIAYDLMKDYGIKKEVL